MSRRYPAPEPDGDDLLTLLAEQESGPRPCPHRFSAGKRGFGWAHETDPASPYFEEWVHNDPACKRSAFPGKNRDPIPTMGWSRELQKDVPL